MTNHHKHELSEILNGLEICNCWATHLVSETWFKPGDRPGWNEMRRTTLKVKGGLKLEELNMAGFNHSRAMRRVEYVTAGEVSGYVKLQRNGGYRTLSRGLRREGDILYYTEVDGAASSLYPTEEETWEIPLSMLAQEPSKVTIVTSQKKSLGFYTQREQEECFS